MRASDTIGSMKTHVVSGLLAVTLLACTPAIIRADVITDLTAALAGPETIVPAVPVSTNTAATPDVSVDRSALIASLQAMVVELTKKLADLLAARAQVASISQSDTSAAQDASASVDIPRTLSFGSRGTDVVSLQRFLIARGLLSPDSATGYFGRATEKAVQEWQSRNGIVSSGTPDSTGFGVVGKRTREALRGIASSLGMHAQAGNGGNGAGTSASAGAGAGIAGAITPGASSASSSGGVQTTFATDPGRWAFDGLSWKKGDLHNASGSFLHPYSLTKPAEITHTLTSRHALEPARSVTIGFDKNGGGYASSAKITGFGSLPSGFETTVMGYGRGLLGAIRDRMHSNVYNPEQAGRTDHLGVVTSVIERPGSVLVPQFQAPLYQDGGDGKPTFPFSAEASEFDFSSVDTDAAATYGIPAVEHKEYWAWARSPDAIKQFLSGTLDSGQDVYQPKQLIKDISPDVSRSIKPASTDMSFLVHVFGGTRADSSFHYLHYRSGGAWKVAELESAEQAAGDKGVIWDCRFLVPNADSFVFDATGGKVSLTPVSSCALDLPFVALSNSPEPDADTAVGIYIPQDAWNTQQTRVIDSVSGATLHTEDRRFAVQFAIGGVIQKNNYATGPFRFLTARQYLSGMLSPDSAAKAYGAGAIEVLTDKKVFLYGTPNEILGAVQGMKPVQPAVSAVQPTDTTTGYDIIVVAGQSNSVGQGRGSFTDPDADTATDSRIVQLSRGGNGITSASGGSACSTVDKVLTSIGKLIGGTLYDGLQHWGAHCRTASLGFGLSFARAYVREELAPGRKVLIVPAGYGGTSIVQWQPGADKMDPGNTNNLYQDMKQRVQAALAQPGDNRVVAFLWSQGESDALSMSGTGLGKYPGMTQPQFVANLENLFSAVRADVPAAKPFPILTTRLAPNWSQWTTCNTDGTVRRYIDIATGKSLANDAISSVAGEGRFAPAAAIDSTGLGNENDVCDQVIPGNMANPHFDAAAQVTLGKRFLASWKTASTPAAQCVFNGQSVANGGTVTAWQTSSVSAGQSCVSETRTCTDGVLSGTFAYPSCAVSNREPAGSFFSINTTGIASGYAYDLDAPSQSVTLSIYRDGPQGSGTLVDSFTTPVQRDDINARYNLTGLHGFSWQIPSGDLSSAHQWYVYAEDANKPGVMTLLSGGPKTFPGAATCTLSAPASATAGQQITVSWTSTGAAKATLSQSGTGLSQSITDLPSGSATVSAPSSTGNFVLTVIDDNNVYGRCTARVVISSSSASAGTLSQLAATLEAIKALLAR